METRPRANFVKQLREYQLTRTESLYHMPDHPGVLQTHLGQDLDMAPEYPVLKKFLRFWQTNLDGKPQLVNVATGRLVTPVRFPVNANAGTSAVTVRTEFGGPTTMNCERHSFPAADSLPNGQDPLLPLSVQRRKVADGLGQDQSPSTNWQRAKWQRRR